MKKMNYKTPSIEVIELKMQFALLAGSDGIGSTSDPNNPKPWPSRGGGRFDDDED